MGQKKKNEKKAQRKAIKRVAVVAGLIGVAGVALVIRNIMKRGHLSSGKATVMDMPNPHIVNYISDGENATFWNNAFSEGLSAFIVNAFQSEDKNIEILVRMAEEGRKCLIR